MPKENSIPKGKKAEKHSSIAPSASVESPISVPSQRIPTPPSSLPLQNYLSTLQTAVNTLKASIDHFTTTITPEDGTLLQVQSVIIDAQNLLAKRSEELKELKRKEDEIVGLKIALREVGEVFKSERQGLIDEIGGIKKSSEEERRETKTLLMALEKEKENIIFQMEQTTKVLMGEKEDLEKTIQAGFFEKIEALNKAHDKDTEKWADQVNELKEKVKKERNNFQILDVLHEKGEIEIIELRRGLDKWERLDLEYKVDDDYFIDAFASLWDSILDFAERFTDYYSYLPEGLDLSSLVVGESFLKCIPISLSPVSHNLRAAYVAHEITDTLVKRVLNAFIFVLNHNDLEFNMLFEKLSSNLPKKQENIWRNLTLQAMEAARFTAEAHAGCQSGDYCRDGVIGEEIGADGKLGPGSGNAGLNHILEKIVLSIYRRIEPVLNTIVNEKLDIEKTLFEILYKTVEVWKKAQRNKQVIKVSREIQWSYETDWSHISDCVNVSSISAKGEPAEAANSHVNTNLEGKQKPQGGYPGEIKLCLFPSFTLSTENDEHTKENMILHPGVALFSASIILSEAEKELDEASERKKRLKEAARMNFTSSVSTNPGSSYTACGKRTRRSSIASSHIGSGRILQMPRIVMKIGNSYAGGSKNGYDVASGHERTDTDQANYSNGKMKGLITVELVDAVKAHAEDVIDCDEGAHLLSTEEGLNCVSNRRDNPGSRREQTFAEGRGSSSAGSIGGRSKESFGEDTLLGDEPGEKRIEHMPVEDVYEAPGKVGKEVGAAQKIDQVMKINKCEGINVIQV